MGACYPDQVGGHKPCVPVVGFELMSPCGIVYVLGHDGDRGVWR